MRILALPLTLAIVAATVSAEQPPPVVVNPHLSTDKSVDTGTIDRIVASLVRPGMTDEQKVLAVFHWVRRVLYHGDGPDDLAYDFGVMVHVLGNGSCLRQTSPLAMLLGRLGYESRSWVHDGHHMLEVKYGGRWHCLDPHMCFYVYDRSEPPVIASVEQLRADASLAGDAVKEGRACPGYLHCGDSPAVFGPGGEWVNDRFAKVKIDEPFGRITLRRGETYTRTWMPDPQNNYFRRAWQRDCGPFHTCTVRKDMKDSVNWPLYEPHIADVDGGKFKAARHWGSGTLTYKPDLRTGHYRDAVVRARNVVHDPARGLVMVDPAQPAELVLSVDCPYVLTAAEIVVRASADEKVAVAVSTDKGKSWHAVRLEPGGGKLGGVFSDRVHGSFEGYQVRLTLTGGVAIDEISLDNRFHLNPYALPYLVPGRNVVKVEAERLGSPVKVEWTYAEGPEWKTERTASKTFAEPGTFTIDVKGEKYPRNAALTLSVAP